MLDSKCRQRFSSRRDSKFYVMGLCRLVRHISTEKMQAGELNIICLNISFRALLVY